MAKINLLPPDLGPNASVLKFLNVSKKISYMIGLLFVISATLLVGYIVFLKIEIKASEKRSDSYKDSIKTFESTEQGLYLLKERIGKITKLIASEDKIDSFTDSGTLLINSYGVSLTQVSSLKEKISLTGASRNADAIGTFFESIIGNEKYKSIDLTSFVFNPKTGYVFSLDIILK